MGLVYSSEQGIYHNSNNATYDVIKENVIMEVLKLLCSMSTHIITRKKCPPYKRQTRQTHYPTGAIGINTQLFLSRQTWICAYLITIVNSKKQLNETTQHELLTSIIIDFCRQRHFSHIAWLVTCNSFLSLLSLVVAVDS